MNRIAALCSILLSVPALAGPLDPPAGPIASTAKPLAEIEPRIAINATNTPGDADSVFRISTPGSYYLGANFTASSGKAGIEIATSNVTVDLNGFTITSVANVSVVRLVGESRSNISVRNGNIGTSGGHGIDIRPNDTNLVTKGGTIENVHVFSAHDVGVAVGTGVTLINVTVVNAGANGIVTGDACSLESCAVRDSDDDGIVVGYACTLTNCAALTSGGSGISADGGAVITGCVAVDNGGVGIRVGTASSVTGCSAYTNGQEGMFCSGVGTLFSGCTSSVNTLAGFANGASGVLNACIAANNDGPGFRIGVGSNLIGCVGNGNAQEGVVCSSDCLIKDSTFRTNGAASAAAGVHATGDNNRIDGNHCQNNDFGIDVDGVGNVIVRNTCADNTQNFVLGPNNIHGAIVDRSSPGTPAVIGNAAAGTMGSNDPNANFAH